LALMTFAGMSLAVPDHADRELPGRAHRIDRDCLAAAGFGNTLPGRLQFRRLVRP